MARTYKTLSLSLHPDVVKELERLGKQLGLTPGRIAAQIVSREASPQYGSREQRLKDIKRALDRATDEDTDTAGTAIDAIRDLIKILEENGTLP